MQDVAGSGERPHQKQEYVEAMGGSIPPRRVYSLHFLFIFLDTLFILGEQFGN